MKYKTISIKGNKQDQFIRIIASKFGVSAENEIKVISILVKYDMFQAFWLDKYTRLKFINEIGCPPSTFNNALARLVESNVIARNGKTMYFNTAFRNINDIDSIMFKYINEESESK